VPTADVVATAKRDLKAGEVLDGGGGYLTVGQSEKASVVKEQALLPLGLSEGVVLKRAKAQGEVIAYADVELDEDSFVLALRREQDELCR
jgi:predicted homoserine dehydrogenase-like protein